MTRHSEKTGLRLEFIPYSVGSWDDSALIRHARSDPGTREFDVLALRNPRLRDEGCLAQILERGGRFSAGIALTYGPPALKVRVKPAQGVLPTVTRLFTIGHSTRSIEEFLSLLKEHGIELVGDIRSFPSSRKFPHFGRERLEAYLSTEGIGYEWYKDLGGFRKRSIQDSPNTGLSSPGFRNYADHMGTEAFRAAAAELVRRASMKRTTVMCAEGLYWKCHRRILSDYLVGVLDVEVVHILGGGKTAAHKLTEGALRTKGGIVYPATSNGA